jgi:PKD repeat protein
MYVLKLSATDVFGDDSHTVERFVEVKAGTGVTVENNTPPVVDAGPNLSIVRSPMSTFSYTFSEAAVHDDTPTGVLNVHWYIVSGPEGGMRFNDSSAVNPVVTFFKTGTYLLQLSADDSEYCVSDEVAITVEETTSASPAINVYAGPDKEIKQPASALLTEASITDSDTGEPYPLEEIRLSCRKSAPRPGSV